MSHRGWLDVLHLVAAVVVGVVVYRAVDGAAGLQFLQMVDQQGVVEGVRMIVVQLAAFLERQVIVALVVAVVRDQAYFVLAELLFQPQGKGGLATAGTACDADDQVVHSCYSSCAEICRFWWKKRTEWFIIKMIAPLLWAAGSPAGSPAFYHSTKTAVWTEPECSGFAAVRPNTARKRKMAIFSHLLREWFLSIPAGFLLYWNYRNFYRRKQPNEQDFTDRHRRHAGGL